MKPYLLVLVIASFCGDAALEAQTQQAVGNEQNDRVSILISRLKDPNSNVREFAAIALGEIKDPRAVEPLLTALKDPNSDVRVNAAIALGNIKDPRTVEPLIVALTNPNRKDATAAAIALGEIKDPRAVEPLIEALKNSDSNTQDQAARALGEIKDPRAVGPLITALRQSYGLIEAQALSKIGTPSVEPLIAVLNDPGVKENQYADEWAAMALGEIKDPRAIRALLAALKNSDYRVRREAGKALGEIKDPRAVDPLIAALKDPDIRIRGYAASVLSEIRDPRATSALRMELPSIAKAKEYIFLIERGSSSSEDILIEALQKFGYREMAVDFLNCGNSNLEQAARSWAANHRYKTVGGGEGGQVSWGAPGNARDHPEKPNAHADRKTAASIPLLE